MMRGQRNRSALPIGDSTCSVIPIAPDSLLPDWQSIHHLPPLTYFTSYRVRDTLLNLFRPLS